MLDTNVEFTRPLRVIISSRGTRGPSGLEWIDDDWIEDETYYVNRALSHNGSSYRVIQEHTAAPDNEPGIGSDWEDFWEVIALGSDVDNINTVASIADEIQLAANNIAAIQNAPNAAIIAANSAAVASGLASAFIVADNTFASIPAVQGWHPSAAPDYLNIAGYSDALDGGGSPYKKSATEPTHSGKFQITLDDNTTQWYELAGHSVSPEMFGAKGDGTNDDGDAVFAALTAASTYGFKFTGNKRSTYRINRQVSINRTAVSPDLLIDWNGAHVYIDETGGISIGASSATNRYLTTSFSVYPNKGDAFLVLTDVTGISKGDQIFIETPVDTGGGNVMHYYLVEEVDGNDVYIEGTVIADINPEQVIADGATGDIIVRCSKMPRRCEMRNGYFTSNDPNGQRTATNINGHYRVVVDNMEYYGHTRNQLSLFSNGHTLTTRIKFHDFGYVEKDRGYASYPTDPGGLGYGYGLIHARNCFSTVRDVVGGRGWHVTDVSRGQMQIWFYNVICLRNSYGLAQHPGCWSTTYINCHTFGNASAQVGNAVFLTMIDCTFKDFKGNGVVYFREASYVHVQDCIFYGNTRMPSVVTSAISASTGSVTPSASTNSSEHEQYFIFKNNTVIHRGRIGLGLPLAENVIITGNTIDLVASVGVSARSAKRLEFSNNTLGKIHDGGAYSGRAVDLNYSEGIDANITNNTIISTRPSVSSYYAFYITRVNNAKLTFKNNTTNCFGVVGLAAGEGTATVSLMVNNTSLNGAIARQPDVIVKNSINNTGTTANFGGATVLKDVGYNQIEM